MLIKVVKLILLKEEVLPQKQCGTSNNCLLVVLVVM